MSHMDDWELAGSFIQSEQVYVSSTTQAFAKRAETSSATLYKIFHGWPSARPQTIAGIERALGWPYGTIAAIRAHDLDWLRTNDLPADTLQRFTDALNRNHEDHEATA